MHVVIVIQIDGRCLWSVQTNVYRATFTDWFATWVQNQLLPLRFYAEPYRSDSSTLAEGNLRLYLNKP